MSKYLDETGLTHLWGKLKALFAGKADKENGVYVVKGTQTANTASWTGELDVDALYDGLTIAYYLPRTSAANATLNLTLKNGRTTGPINVYVTNTTRMGTHVGAGATVLLTYWSAGSITVNGTATTEPRWTSSDYWNSNTIGEYGGACIAGPNGMARYSLIMQVSEDRWESLVLTSGTGTSKAKNPSGFLITSPILYQSGGNYAEGAACAYSGSWASAYSIDTRYSFNVSSNWSAAGRPLYLVGSINVNDGKFYLNDSGWWTDSLPEFDFDGFFYLYLGQMQDAYRFTLHPTHPMYCWLDGKWQTAEAYLYKLLTEGFKWGDIGALGSNSENNE